MQMPGPTRHIVSATFVLAVMVMAVGAFLFDWHHDNLRGCSDTLCRSKQKPYQWPDRYAHSVAAAEPRRCRDVDQEKEAA